MSQQPVAAMILAAGASERYGQPKALLDWHGQPLMAHIARTVLASPARPVVVVLGALIVEPRFRDQPGAPALFTRQMFPELMQLTGERGGRPLINKYADRVAVVQVGDLATLKDIDTPEDYREQMSNLQFPISNFQSLADIRAVVSDMDGVLWRGDKPMPGLIEFFAFLRERDIHFILATNNATRTARQYADKLAGHGVKVSEAEILPSCDVVSDYLVTIAKPGTRVFVVGEAALVESLRARGFVISQDEAEFVVAGLDRQVTYAKVACANRLIRNGAKFIGTNPDKTWPSETEITPGAGAVLAFIEAAAGVKPFIVAKPEPVMFQQALTRLGARPEETVMIGDRLETDIEGGLRAGLKTILVLSGISTEADVEQTGIRPDWTFQDIGELTQVWKSLKRQ